MGFETVEGLGASAWEEASTSAKFQPAAAVAFSTAGFARVADVSSDTSPSSFSSSRAVSEAAVDRGLRFRTVWDGRHSLFSR